MKQLLRTPLSFGAFALLLAVLLALPLRKSAGLAGDVDEYVLMTIAIASHGSPDIRPGDIATAKRVMPFYFVPRLEALEAGIASGRIAPLPGFYQGTDKATYAIHFFAYSGLAAVPYRLLEALGADPLKCYQLLNLLAMFGLGLTLFRYFGNATRAFTALGLFVLAGGSLYWNWSSPEVLSAASLLAAFLWFAMGAPLLGGALAGLATMQNPTIVFALAFLPLMWAWQQRSLAALLNPRLAAGLALGGLLFAWAPLFNLAKFGTPSIIAKVAASAALVSGERLFSLFFDLNQGMVVAIPAIAAMLLCWGWRAANWRRELQLLLLCAAATLAFCVPALSVVNWNSGAAGVMRYAFWAAMPLLFALLHRLRAMAAWPARPLAILLLVQTFAMVLAYRYSHVEFSPLARWVMSHYPQAYNPEPELFAERSAGGEVPLDAMKTYQWKDQRGNAVKTLYFAGPGAPVPGESLCGPGKVIQGRTPPVSAASGWVYLNGPVACAPVLNIDAGQPGLLASGWQAPDVVNDKVPGVWGVAPSTTLTIELPPSQHADRVRVLGDYLPGTLSPRSRITVNGRDMGWHDLRAPVFLELPQDGTRRLTIELLHDQPPPQEGKALFFYLKSITLI
jgi:hypothetical protein